MLLGKLAEKQQIGTFLKAEVAVLGKSGNQIFDIVTTIEELAVCGNRFTIDNFCGTDFRDLRQSDQNTFSVQIAQTAFDIVSLAWDYFFFSIRYSTVSGVNTRSFM